MAIKTHQKIFKNKMNSATTNKCRKKWKEMRRERIEGEIKEDKGGRIKK